MIKMPTPVAAMKTWSVATGQTKATTYSPWWAMLWAWATSGGFPTSPTRTAEVLNGGGWVGTPYNPRGWARFVKAECEHYPGIVPADGNGKRSRRHLCAFRIPAEEGNSIWF